MILTVSGKKAHQPDGFYGVAGQKARKIYKGFLVQGGICKEFYNWGTGTEEDPYRIYTYSDLRAINDDPEGYYRLEADITENYPNLIHRPIGSEAMPFTGVLDGNHHSIKLRRKYGVSGLTSGGLFGVNAGTIKNLDFTTYLTAADDLSDYEHFGLLAGVNLGTIEHCRIRANWVHNSGDVIFGGAVGHNAGSIKTVECRIQPTGSVGKLGIIAGTNEGWIFNVYGDAMDRMTTDGTVGYSGEVAYCTHTMTAGSLEAIACWEINGTEAPGKWYYNFIGGTSIGGASQIKKLKNINYMPGAFNTMAWTVPFDNGSSFGIPSGRGVHLRQYYGSSYRIIWDL